MDDASRTYRNVKTDVKQTARGIDGTDFKDRQAPPETGFHHLAGLVVRAGQTREVDRAPQRTSVCAV